ncbi:MAG: NAD(+) synthase [Deltaproteobacteria bacterium]|nr:NAD(+) synthase [Deltaproteobacteria bacterium]
MRLVRVGAAVLNQVPLDWDGNERRIRAVLADARDRNVAVLCLPEMCTTGYGCEDAFQSPATLAEAWRVLDAVLPETRGLIATLGLPVLHHGSLFNAVAVCCDGKLLGLVAKRNLAGDGLHYEPRWFKAWPNGVVDRWRTPDGEMVPIGDLLFDCGGLRIGLEVCEDAWVAQRPGATLAGRGIDFILNPSASHFAFDKNRVRERFVIEGSRAFAVTYVYANLLGNEAGRAIYDGGALVATGGAMVARGKRFSFAETGLTVATVDVEATRVMQARTASYTPRFDEEDDLVSAPFIPPPAPLGDGAGVGGDAEADLAAPEAWEATGRVREEEFTRAVTLALLDYLRKSYSRGFVVSLSGGADSAAVSALVALMVERALRELGRDGLEAKLAYLGPGWLARTAEDVDAEDVDGTAKALVRRLLTTAYQATKNSGDVTRHAAADIADALGSTHYELDVEDLVVGYRSRVEKALGRELSWATDDLALQNIQARVRGPSVWMLANITSSLLLATSNRSEAAVGYATMDGDTCGGISPIAGIDKAFLRSWLRWLETDGPLDLGPVPAMAAVNAQQPTAELRPPEYEQTDEGDLMPYPVLDAIEAAAIRDKHGPAEVYRLMRSHYADREALEVLGWVERFFRLWSRNQWKRERYAPSFHVDDRGLDPRTWCRFPILSGGYARELRELRARVETET